MRLFCKIAYQSFIHRAIWILLHRDKGCKLGSSQFKSHFSHELTKRLERMKYLVATSGLFPSQLSGSEPSGSRMFCSHLVTILTLCIHVEEGQILLPGFLSCSLLGRLLS